MLQIIDASKQFGKTMVLNRLNLTIAENSIVGLAGPSGSGKSTLLRCIQHLELLDSGTIQFTGQSGFIFQDFQLFPHMTVLKNMVYAPTRHNKHGHHIEKAMDLLTTLELADKAQVYPQQLSGGQKQRVALARSLMMQPDLLLCDEPTSGLDMASIGSVITLLNTAKSMQKTMIIASHDLEFLTQIADRIILLKEGHLAADIQPMTLVDPISHLKQYYQLQSEGT
ncbi:amino acid ABC transporter ATP-binding protein [Legionella oakridgensis]|uniref:ABC-type polar amino acid transport system, ATPase component n=2 Tax=Legionella oakridgensis TaxID=29423 RepID=W0BEZ4_9GAMM|nr:ATP-binding cassette domain-containing protein [Legionella oakridgensis]AHE66999.1 ABC-type polar amino acid transport system, ATPase component [Legionella oakridgensis ATCC 33761 = DSM 21215]ETO93357.1 amino acid ABC transporter ATP-binding protein, PAAT family [Legionella oakridgensis RV-2-2007]KTD38349.1 ABC transporter ATP-binding protein [Legionella oakridgensis]STY20098.1 ABC transporter ATP-binding protein [Legionella longbeachae]